MMLKEMYKFTTMSRIHFFLIKVVFIYLIFLTSSVFGGNTFIKTDSLKQVLLTSNVDTTNAKVLLGLAKAYQTSSLDTALFYSNQLQELSNNINDKQWLLEVLHFKTSTYKYYDNYDSTLAYGRQTLQLAEQLKDYNIKLDAIIDLADVFDRTGHFDKAIKYYLMGLKLANELKLNVKSVLFLTHIGNAYRSHKEGELALKYLEEAHERINALVKKDSTNYELSNLAFGTKINLALAYDMVNKKEQAIFIFKSLLSNTTTQTIDSSRIYTNIARSYILLEKYDLALIYLDHGILLRERINSPFHSAYAYKEYATLYRKTKEYEKSINYGLKVLEVGEKLDDVKHLEDAYRNLRDSYYANEDYKNSADYGKKLQKLYYKIFSQEKQALVVEMETKYQTTKKEKEIEQLKFQNLLDKKNNTIMVGGIIFLLLLILLIIYVLKSGLKKQKIEKKLLETQLLLNKQELEKKQQE